MATTGRRKQTICIKYIIFGFNFLFSMAGAAVFATSIAFVLNSDFKNYVLELINVTGVTNIQITELNFVVYLLAVASGITFVVGFLGCAGAIFENTCMLGLFFSIIFLLFLTELGCTVTLWADFGKFQSSFNVFYYNTVIPDYVTNYNTQNNLVQVVDQIQNKFNCCGCNNYTDFTFQGWPSNQTLPCSQLQKGQGCCNILWSQIQSGLSKVAIVTFCFLLIELFAMVFICCLCAALRKS